MPMIAHILARSTVALAALALPVASAIAEDVPRGTVTAALPQLENIAEGLIAAGEVPGLAIAIVHEDDVVYLKGFGVREAGKPALVDADTVFQLASMSKPLSATIVAALVGEGVVDWDSRIATIDPAFQLKQAYPTAQVTVRDLFSHRSGLPGEAGNDLEGIGYDRGEILHRLRLVEPSSSFRAGYSYSNFGLTAGAVAAARRTGKSWEEVAAEWLYRPLGMTSTSSRHSDFLAHANRSALHVRVGGAWKAAFTREPDAQAPAGGVSSNVRDLAQWMRLEIAKGRFGGRQLIPEAPLAATHEPVISRGANPVNGAASFYGLGWNLEFGRHGLVWGHAGAFSVGARTTVSIDPGRKLGIVVLTGAFPTGVPDALVESFYDLVIAGRVTKDWTPAWNAAYTGMFAPAVEASKARWGTPPSPASPALPAAAYAGTYENAYFGRATIAADGPGLALKLGPAGKSFTLRHFDRDTFLYAPSPEMPDVLSSLRFAIGADGNAEAMTSEDLDAFGLGRMRRVEQ